MRPASRRPGRPGRAGGGRSAAACARCSRGRRRSPRAAVAGHHVRAHRREVGERRLEHQHARAGRAQQRRPRARGSPRSAAAARRSIRSRMPPPETQAAEDIGFRQITVSSSAADEQIEVGVRMDAAVDVAAAADPHRLVEGRDRARCRDGLARRDGRAPAAVEDDALAAGVVAGDDAAGAGVGQELPIARSTSSRIASVRTIPRGSRPVSADRRVARREHHPHRAGADRQRHARDSAARSRRSRRVRPARRGTRRWRARPSPRSGPAPPTSAPISDPDGGAEHGRRRRRRESPVRASSASRAPMIHDAPTTPPAPRARPIRMLR